MKEMVGGCCVCSDERGWTENPLVYCDGQGCNVAVHQACYGIVEVPTGPWFCRKCLSQERNARVKCELCPSKDGALKRTDSSGWAHVVCALYIPEVRFGNVSTMEPIILQLVPHDRYNKICYICEEQGKESKASFGACMQCNKAGCKQYFHVTCAQAAGLLCEEAGNYMDNVKYCGYCQYHYQKLVSYKKGSSIKTIPAFKPIPADNATPEPSPEKHSPKNADQKDRKTKADRKARPSCSGIVLNHTSKELTTTVTPPSTSDTIGAGSPSDSSTSTSTLSTNGSNSTEDSKKAKSSFSSKFTTASFKEISATQSTTSSSSVTTDKSKKKKNDSHSEKNSPESSKGSPSCKSPTKPGLTFSGIYENFINTDLSGRSDVKKEEATKSRSINEAKRTHSFSIEGGEKKKSKHSKTKGKSNKISSDHTVIVNNQIPIVRIKRNFPHDISSDSHIDKSCVIEQPSKSKTPPAKVCPETIVKPPEELVKEIKEEISLSPVCVKPIIEKKETEKLIRIDTPEDRARKESAALINIPNGIECKVELPTLDEEHHGSQTILKPTFPSPEKVEPRFPDQFGLPPMPQTLEELLERQWEQGSNFLMEQAQHFDIASLLNCLNQLQSENKKLEVHVKNLISRRDHLLSVNSRLRLPLDSVVTYPSLIEESNPVTEAATNGLSAIVGETSASTNFLSFENTLVHSTQDPNYLKSPHTGCSPMATVGSSSLPLTPSPIPSSPSLRTNPLIQGTMPPTAVYQSISPPFGSPGTSLAAANLMAANTNHVFQNFPPTSHKSDSHEENDR